MSSTTSSTTSSSSSSTLMSSPLFTPRFVPHRLVWKNTDDVCYECIDRNSYASVIVRIRKFETSNIELYKANIAKAEKEAVQHECLANLTEILIDEANKYAITVSENPRGITFMKYVETYGSEKYFGDALQQILTNMMGLFKILNEDSKDLCGLPLQHLIIVTNEGKLESMKVRRPFLTALTKRSLLPPYIRYPNSNPSFVDISSIAFYAFTQKNLFEFNTFEEAFSILEPQQRTIINELLNAGSFEAVANVIQKMKQSSETEMANPSEVDETSETSSFGVCDDETAKELDEVLSSDSDYDIVNHSVKDDDDEVRTAIAKEDDDDEIKTAIEDDSDEICTAVEEDDADEVETAIEDELDEICSDVEEEEEEVESVIDDDEDETKTALEDDDEVRTAIGEEDDLKTAIEDDSDESEFEEDETQVESDAEEETKTAIEDEFDETKTAVEDDSDEIRTAIGDDRIPDQTVADDFIHMEKPVEIKQKAFGFTIEYLDKVFKYHPKFLVDFAKLCIEGHTLVYKRQFSAVAYSQLTIFCENAEITHVTYEYCYGSEFHGKCQNCVTYNRYTDMSPDAKICIMEVFVAVSHAFRNLTIYTFKNYGIEGLVVKFMADQKICCEFNDQFIQFSQDGQVLYTSDEQDQMPSASFLKKVIADLSKMSEIVESTSNKKFTINFSEQQ